MNRVSQDPSYRTLKAYVIESTGLAFYADRDELLAELIGERLSELELSDCSAYGAFPANGEAGQAEMDVLIAQLTIGETYFFRDQSQFEAIRDVILPDERKKDARELRIWSAACATGPEPYSLAILLADEMAGQAAGWQISIYATDLNREYLAQAARGKYRDWAFRDTPEAVAPKPPPATVYLPPTVHPAAEDAAGLQQLADRGDWQGAEAYGRRLLTSNRLNPAIYFYQALLFENLERPAESERSPRRAIYLNRNFALAHYHLGLALKRNQREAEAARAFGNVVRVLAGMPVEAMIPGGSGLTVTELKELTKTQLRQEPPQ